MANSCVQDILYKPGPDSQIGARNDAAAPGTAQYNFLIGDWNVEVTLNRPGQDTLTYTAKWHNHWVANGFMIIQEWRGPYVTGVEMRSYDAAENVWHGRNIYLFTTISVALASVTVQNDRLSEVLPGTKVDTVRLHAK